ncbi:MAG: hypothetical protein MUF84_00300 [Anaerolineae bacterium]|jgi:hypothetical protein|nr:hypothetical protein [Anaerolineae bacterium]
MGSLFALVGVIGLLLAAIGRSLESGTWEGFFTAGRAGRIFHPCGTRALWWVQNAALGDTADDLERRYMGIALRPYEQVYIRFRGEASRKGQYGPLGSYQRVVYVDEILELREQREGDCGKSRDME